MMVQKLFFGVVAIIGFAFASTPRNSVAQEFYGQQFATQPYSAPYVGYWYGIGHGYTGSFVDPVFYGTIAYSSAITPQMTFTSGVNSWNSGTTQISFDAVQSEYDWFDFWP